MRFFPAFLLFLIFAQTAGAQVMVVELKDTITSASDDIVSEALNTALIENVEALIIILDTPGGGLEETKKIIEHIDGSPVPVIGYVYPKGATAWSAGTLILLGTDVAAMTPNTIIGSAQPVEITSEGLRPVKEAKVIEIVAPSIEDLLTQLDGMNVKGKELKTSGISVTYYSPSLRLAILNLLSNPILASLLMLVGIYALVFGLTSPGYGAEIFGVISISLGLIGLGFSVNIAALFLIALGMALLIFELYTPSFGLIGLAGIACIVLGSILLVPIGYPGLYSPEFLRTLLISLLAPAIILGAFVAFAIYQMMKIRTKKPAMGEIVGDTAETIDAITPDATGYVRYQGEYWIAKSGERIEPKTKVVITGKDGAVLIVRSLSGSPAPE